jgi:hypothetical protein
VADLLAHQRSMVAVLVLLTLLAAASASLCPRLKGKLDFEPQKVKNKSSHCYYHIQSKLIGVAIS